MKICERCSADADCMRCIHLARVEAEAEAWQEWMAGTREGIPDADRRAMIERAERAYLREGA